MSNGKRPLSSTPPTSTRTKTSRPGGAAARAQRGSGGGAHTAGDVDGARGAGHHAVAICGALVVAIAIVFGQTVHHHFVNYDDERYVVENPHVTRGVTAEGIGWALTGSHASNWHPLTWISHMADCQVYGLRPGGHHLTNVVLHALTTIVLFVVLRGMTRGTWRSAFVAALFAIHPLHVESVAWIAERKDVLSGLFFVLTLAAYAAYVRAPFAIGRYLLAVLTFALGLMSKPMLVTVPLVLLLLDYWPLARFGSASTAADAQPRPTGRSLTWLLIEKVPFLALAAASSVITYVVQGKARGSGAQFDVYARVGNALVSYVTYIVKFVYPINLSAFYPHPGDSLPSWQVSAACAVLIAMTAVAVAVRRRHPYLFVGWLWYVGMLVPVIGLVQVGEQAMADRYTYLTQIGLYIAAAWTTVAVTRSSPTRRRAVAGAAAGALVVLAALAWRQTSTWSTSETLWTQALASTSGNYEAHNGLARALARRGDLEGAIAQYRMALEIKPDFVDARNNLGNALAARGQVGEAIAEYERALRIAPDHAEAHNNLALALAARGERAAAIAHYRRALALEPDFADAHYNLGNALAEGGRADEAIAEYLRALDLRSGFAEAHANLGTVLAGRGQIDMAIDQYRQALAIDPALASARRNLAILEAERAPQAR